MSSKILLLSFTVAFSFAPLWVHAEDTEFESAPAQQASPSPSPSPTRRSSPYGSTGPMSADRPSTLHPQAAPSASPSTGLTVEAYVRTNGAPNATASGTPSEPATAGSPSEAKNPRLRAGDAAFLERKNPEKARESLQLYRSAYKDHPDDFETGWRLAMSCYFNGIRIATSEDEKKALFSEGRDAGRRASKLNPRCAPCHFWTAINMALYGETSGVFKQYFQLNEVKDHLRRSIAVDPKYAYSGAYRLLGLIDQQLPGILGGDNARAKTFFEKAIETSPDEPLNYLFLARLLKEALGQKAKAMEIARKGLQVPPPSEERLESIDAIADLKKFVAENQ